MSAHRSKAKRPSIRQVHQLLTEMIDRGFIEWTGEYKNGAKVYRVTEAGMAFGVLPLPD